MEKGGGTCHHSSLVGIKAMSVPRIRMKPKYSHTRHSIDILVTWYLVSVLRAGVGTHTCMQSGHQESFSIVPHLLRQDL